MRIGRRSPFGSWLLGGAEQSGRALAARSRLLLLSAAVIANIIGATVVVALAVLVIPLPDIGDTRQAITTNIAVAVAWVLLGLFFGFMLGSRLLRSTYEWVRAERPPTDRERRRALLAPTALFVVHLVFWTLAAASFGAMNAFFDAKLVVPIGITVAIGGIVTSANAYLFSERLLRPVTARALAHGVPRRLFVPGVTARNLLAWMLGTGAPIAGLLTIGVYALMGDHVSSDELAIAVIALATVVLAFGFLLSLIAARATAEPVQAVRDAIRDVQAGDLDTQVPVYDATEVGLLQAGFNRMAAGLREREHIRDLFGRHVGEEVARSALESEMELGGEVREVAVLFVDIIGSTQLAASRPPQEVVALLNRFFAIVIEAVEGQGGWVNKFEGDAALAIFGAPIPLENAAGAALAAGRELSRRLDDEVAESQAGIGVSAGQVVAGNIGAEHRYEYTVIGDPVNEAARLTELAKDAPGHLLAAERALAAADEEEAAHWELGEAMELRGRSESTRLAHPRDHGRHQAADG